LKKNAIPSQNLPVSSCKKLLGSNYARNKEAGGGVSSSKGNARSISYHVPELFSYCRIITNASVCSGIMLRSNDAYLE